LAAEIDPSRNLEDLIDFQGTGDLTAWLAAAA
jgi:hypothetical protein